MKGLANAFAVVCTCALVFCVSGCSNTSASASGETASSAVSSPGVASSISADEGAAAPDGEPSSSAGASQSVSSALANGEYVVDVSTDSSMFHINEADEGTGVLTVSDEGMAVHIHLPSKKITKLYAGTVAEAKDDPAGIIEPTTDKVTYSDGAEEEVYGFDVPVPALDEEFNVAILGSKGNWYDHKVIVSNPRSE